jgi:hypothetical protein
MHPLVMCVASGDDEDDVFDFFVFRNRIKKSCIKHSDRVTERRTPDADLSVQLPCAMSDVCIVEVDQIGEMSAEERWTHFCKLERFLTDLWYNQMGLCGLEIFRVREIESRPWTKCKCRRNSRLAVQILANLDLLGLRRNRSLRERRPAIDSDPY